MTTTSYFFTAAVQLFPIQYVNLDNTHVCCGLQRLSYVLGPFFIDVPYVGFNTEADELFDNPAAHIPCTA
ncbi:MAG: hypothetical protein QW470_07740 [Candidatus Caldarchaeum sp.]